VVCLATLGRTALSVRTARLGIAACLDTQALKAPRVTLVHKAHQVTAEHRVSLVTQARLVLLATLALAGSQGTQVSAGTLVSVLQATLAHKVRPATQG